MFCPNKQHYFEPFVCLNLLHQRHTSHHEELADKGQEERASSGQRATEGRERQRAESDRGQRATEACIHTRTKATDARGKSQQWAESDRGVYTHTYQSHRCKRKEPAVGRERQRRVYTHVPKPPMQEERASSGQRATEACIHTRTKATDARGKSQQWAESDRGVYTHTYQSHRCKRKEPAVGRERQRRVYTHVPKPPMQEERASSGQRATEACIHTRTKATDARGKSQQWAESDRGVYTHTYQSHRCQQPGSWPAAHQSPSPAVKLAPGMPPAPGQSSWGPAPEPWSWTHTFPPVNSAALRGPIKQSQLT